MFLGEFTNTPESSESDFRPVGRLTKFLPFLVLLLSLVATYQVWEHTHQIGMEEMEAQFRLHAHLSVSRLEQRMKAYEGILRGLRGLFASSLSVSRYEFRTYVEMLHLQENFPGIQGVGYAELITPSRLEKHKAAIRREGFLDYAVYPSGKREIYSSIIYLEPFAGRNLRAFGFDMYSDTVRRAAMDVARDTGQAAISGRVRLVQEDGNHEQAGFLMYLPVYRNDVPNETVAARRKNIVGWVYAPFRMDDLMAGLHEENSDDIDLEIYDGSVRSYEALIFPYEGRDGAVRNTSPLYSMESSLELGNHSWLVVSSSSPSFEQREADDLPVVLAWSGGGFSVFLSLLTWLLVRDRERALSYASKMQYLSNYDQLTGLPNRVLFAERFQLVLASAKRKKERFALMFIDLDKFKPVNDTYGHEVGDALLKEVACRLKQCLRESDTPARIGGDEFIILLASVRQDSDAVHVADKLLMKLGQPFELDGYHLSVSASIGIAFYPEHGGDLEQLTRNADAAMYRVKTDGRCNIRISEV